MTEFKYLEPDKMKKLESDRSHIVSSVALLEIAYQLKKIADKIEGGEKE